MTIQNAKPGLLTVVKTEQGYTQIKQYFNSDTDFDLTNVAGWRKLAGAARPSAVFNQIPYDRDARVYTFEGLAEGTQYDFTLAFLDSFIASDSSLVSAQYQNLGSLVNFTNTTASTVVPVTISAINNTITDIAAGNPFSTLEFSCSGVADELHIEYKPSAGSTWTTLYKGLPSATVKVEVAGGTYNIRYSSKLYFQDGTSEQSTLSVWGSTVTVESPLAAPAPVSATSVLAFKSRNNTTSTYDIRVNWNYGSDSLSQAKKRNFNIALATNPTATTNYASLDWNNCYKDIAVTAPFTIPNIGYRTHYVVRIGVTGWGTSDSSFVYIPVYVTLNSAESGVLGYVLASEFAFPTNTKIQVDDQFIRGYKVFDAATPANNIKTFEIDAATGNVTIGAVSATYGNKVPFLFDSTANKLQIDGRVITDQIEAASFVMSWISGTTPSLRTAGKTSYDSATSGLWAGYTDASTFKFNIGDTNKFLKWDGSELIISGKVKIDSAGGQTLEQIGAPVVLSLSASSQVFTYNGDDAAAPTNQTITFTATKQNTTSSVVFSTNPAVALSGTGDSRTLTIANFTALGVPSVTVTATVDGVSDTVSVVKIKDGATGAAGTAVTGFLTNEATVVAATSAGSGYSLASAGGTFKVFSGLTDVTTSAAYNITGGTDGGTTFTRTLNGLTFTINKTTGAYSLSGASWTSDAESFTVNAIYSGVTLTKVYTIAKSKAGVAGTNGTNGTNGVDGVSPTVYRLEPSAVVIFKDAVNAATSGTYTTPSSITAARYIGSLKTNNFGFVTITADGDTEAATATAVPVTNYSLASGSGKSSVTIKLYDTSAKTTLLDTMVLPVVFKGSTGSTGAAGSNAITAVLSNESHVFPALSNGTVSSYAGCGTDIFVYENTTALAYVSTLTGNSQFTVTAVSNNITAGAITAGTSPNRAVVAAATTGVAAGTDTSSITYTITARRLDGTTVTLTKVQTFTKSKQGATGSTGSTGATGATGSRGAGRFTIPYAGTWPATFNDTLAAAMAAAVTNSVPVLDDVVTLYSSSNAANQYTRRYNGGAAGSAANWAEFALQVHGDALVNGTLTADKISANILTGQTLTAYEIQTRPHAQTGTPRVVLGRNAGGSAGDSSVPFAIYDNDNSAVLLFNDSGDLIIKGQIGSNTIRSADAFSPELRALLIPDAASGGLVYGNGGSPSRTVATDFTVLMSSANAGTATINFEFEDTVNSLQSTNYTVPTWSITVYRNSVGAGNIIATETLTATKETNREDSQTIFYGHFLLVNRTYTDNTHNTTEGTPLQYIIRLQQTSGKTDFGLAQTLNVSSFTLTVPPTGGGYATTLGGLNDVNTSGAVTGSFLRYNTATGIWAPGSFVAGTDYVAPGGSGATLTNLNMNNAGSGTLAVARGGTGATTLTGIVKGNGTSAMTAAVAGTDYVIPSGNVATATALQTGRTLTVGSTGKSFNGSANVSWTLAEIGAMPLAGGISTGFTDFTVGMGVRPNNYLLFNSNNIGFGWGITETSADGFLRFRSRSDVGAWTDRVTINTSGDITAPTFIGALTGNASTATSLQTARTINGTSFNGTGNITTSSWGTSRTITVGNTGKAVDGSANVSWTLAEIGAPSLTGVGASGTWGIGISGTAATATVLNATLPAGSNMDTGSSAGKLEYYDSNALTGLPVSAWHSVISARHNNGSNVNGFQLAYQFATEVFNVRGSNGSAYTSWRQLVHSGNVGTYAPSLTGAGASGSWAINAATATALANTRSINGVGFNGSSDITVPTLYDSSFTRITNPEGATAVYSNSTVTGAIRITLPVGMTSTMVKMRVKIFEYTAGESFDLELAGYNYGSNNTWNQCTAYAVGEPSLDRQFTVRFGYDSVAGRSIIYIGELNSTWSYPQIAVTEVLCGFSGRSVNWTTGWNIANETVEFLGVTYTRLATQVGRGYSTNVANGLVLRDASGNFSAGTITAALSGNATTATTLASARTLTIGNTGKTFNGSANVSWSLAEIGALPLVGGTLTGDLNITGDTSRFSMNTNYSIHAGGFSTTVASGAKVVIAKYTAPANSRNEMFRVMVTGGAASAGGSGVSTADIFVRSNTLPSKQIVFTRSVSGNTTYYTEIEVWENPSTAEVYIVGTTFGGSFSYMNYRIEMLSRQGSPGALAVNNTLVVFDPTGLNQISVSNTQVSFSNKFTFDGLLVSDSYTSTETAKIPSNGIYSKGAISFGSFAHIASDTTKFYLRRTSDLANILQADMSETGGRLFDGSSSKYMKWSDFTASTTPPPGLENVITTNWLASGVVTTNILAAGAVTAEKITAGSIHADKLSILAREIINPVSLTHNLIGWGGTLEDGSGVPSGLSYDATEDAMALATSGNFGVSSKTFEVDHNKIYRVSFKIKKSTAHGLFYAGVSLFTSPNSGLAGNTSASGSVGILPYDSSRVGGSSNANTYFFNTVGTSYVEYVCYVIGANRSIDDCPNHVGTMASPYLKLGVGGNHAAIRFLNWSNSIATTVFIKDVSVTEVGMGQIVASNIVSRTITADRIALGTLTANEIATNAITADKILAGAITAGKLDVNSVVATNIVGRTITADKIATGTLTANEIAANAITATKMLITGGGTINRDPMLQDSDAWSFSGSIQTVADAPAGNKVLRSNTGVYTVLTEKFYHSIDATKSYKMRFWARAASGTNGKMYFCLRQFTAPGTPCSINTGRSPYKPADVTLTTSWVEYSVEYTPTDWQSGVKFIQLDWLLNYTGTAGYMEICNPRLEEMVSADLLVQGTVQANIIASGGINVEDGGNKVTIHPKAQTPIRFEKDGEETFSISIDGQGFFKGSLAANTVKLDSIDQEARRGINPYYTGYGERYTLAANSFIASSSAATLTALTETTSGDRVNISGRVAEQVRWDETGSRPLYSDSTYQLKVQRSIGGGAWTDVTNGTTTLTVVGYSDPGVGWPEPEPAMAGYYYDRSFNVTDQLTVTNSNVQYRVLVTCTSAGTGTSSGLVFTNLAVEKSAFVKNTATNNSAISRWTDKETGFTIITGKVSSLAPNSSTTVSFGFTLATVVSEMAQVVFSGYGDWSGGAATATTTGVTVYNQLEIVRDVKWVVYGFVAV